MRYQVLLVDPPWAYRNRHLERKDGGKTRFGIGVAGRYTSVAEDGSLVKGGGVMTIDQIKALPIHLIAADDCALFLWTVPPQLDDGMDVLKAWGFRFVNKAFCWTKTYPNGEPFFGTGHYTGGNSEDCILGLTGQYYEDWYSEDCLFGLKGRPNVKSLAAYQDIRTVHTRYLEGTQHSNKPLDIYRRIEALYGTVPRIELFARYRAPGWHATGLDMDGIKIEDALPAISNGIYIPDGRTTMRGPNGEIYQFDTPSDSKLTLGGNLTILGV